MEKDGDSAQVYGQVTFNQQKVPFVAGSFKSQVKAINTLSTVFSTTMEEVEIEKEVLDET